MPRVGHNVRGDDGRESSEERQMLAQRPECLEIGERRKLQPLK